MIDSSAGLVQLELLVDTPDGVEQASARQGLAVEPGTELSGAAVEQLARGDRAAARRSRIVHLEEVDQELDDLRGFGLRLARRRRLAVGALRLEGARRDAGRERQDHDAGRDDGGAISPRELPEDVETSWPAGQDRLETAMPFDVVRQFGSRVVAHLALAGGRLESDPVEVAAQRPQRARRARRPQGGARGALARSESAPARGGRRHFALGHLPQDLQQALPRPSERTLADQELEQQHSQRIDVGARVRIGAIRRRRGGDRLGTQIGRCSDDHAEDRRRRIGRLAIEHFGDSEVDDLRHRATLLGRDQDVRRLDVAMQNPLLVGVVDAATDGDEEIEPRVDRQPLAIAVVGDRLARHVLHGEERLTVLGVSGLVDLGDARMTHPGERLALGLEAVGELRVQT